MQISLRQYRDTDNSLVWDLHTTVLKETGAFVDDPALDADLLDIRRFYLQNGGDFLLAELNGQVIGMGACTVISADAAEIARMRVLGAHQGRGIGRQILDALESSAKSRGIKRFILNTTDMQPLAQKFYIKNGYRETSRAAEKDLTRIYYEKMVD
jgi:ribosomal protein S18 acetylase RimI-like enzyme